MSAIAFFSETNQKSGINKELEEEFRNIIVNGLIFTKCQPIVCLTTGDVVAYEALSRGPEASMFENPAYLFEVAEKLEMLEDLDMLCREKAIMNAHKLGLNTKPIKLFINVENIDKSFKKQAIVKMLVDMCHKVLHSKMVAEGIETFDEFNTINELGIDWGQGYFFGKPSSRLQSVPGHMKNGYIETLDRKNEKCKFPLMSISLAVVESKEQSRFNTFHEIGAVAAEIKKKAKAIQGSIFIVDQRKR